MVIKGLCEAYSCLPDPEKVKFLLVLAEDLQPNDQHVRSYRLESGGKYKGSMHSLSIFCSQILEAIRNYDTTRRTGGEGSVSARYKALKALRTALTPLHEVYDLVVPEIAIQLHQTVPNFFESIVSLPI